MTSWHGVTTALLGNGFAISACQVSLFPGIAPSIS